ncbi:MAG TPA: hypothetical protein VLB44_25905, partial [Kofleriaceae bacterium]|nr:hypothetical protein [Kofleriaceae bacterium]
LFSDASRIRYPRRADCAGHENLGEIRSLGSGSETKLGDLLARAEKELGEGASLDFSRDIITQLSCPECGHTTVGGAVLGAVRESQAACPKCKAHRVVEIASSVSRGDSLDLDLTLAQLGLPPFDIVVARQGMDRQQAWLLDGDAATVLGPLAESWGMQ